MFDALREFLNDILPTDGEGVPKRKLEDKRLSAAVLMAHAIAVDGTVKPEEQSQMLSVLKKHYGLSEEHAIELAKRARQTEEQSIDLFTFTSQLKAQMSETERLGLIEDLWEMVYADGELHEFEDNFVWRVAELLNISSDRRMALKRLVRDRAADG